MAEKTLNDLFLAQLKDIYYAEKKIYRTLPKMVKAAKDAELKKAFTTHREETQGQIERLEQVFEMIGKRPQTKPCEAINGIVAEGEETIEEFGESPAIDTGLVAAGQAVEHYEMARYGALAGWATQLGMPDAAALLNETLQEEMNAEKLLTQIAKSKADISSRHEDNAAQSNNRPPPGRRVAQLVRGLPRAGRPTKPQMFDGPSSGMRSAAFRLNDPSVIRKIIAANTVAGHPANHAFYHALGRVAEQKVMVRVAP